ncbi:conserved protein of unknown function [Ruminococcaceae bacterium BL-6]|nr:conserved protein of unknown function [Ruminococcaceae bacterium BL-6]
MTDKELEKSVIDDFWGWVQKYKDDVYVQFYSEKDCFFYVGFDKETLYSFTDHWQELCEEGGCPATIQTNGICFDLQDVIGGYGFTMQEAWDARPVGIENKLGSNIL